MESIISILYRDHKLFFIYKYIYASGHEANFSPITNFRTVAECRGYTKAANTLPPSQPAVSMQIKQLEQQVVKPLSWSRCCALFIELFLLIFNPNQTVSACSRHNVSADGRFMSSQYHVNLST